MHQHATAISPKRGSGRFLFFWPVIEGTGEWNAEAPSPEEDITDRTVLSRQVRTCPLMTDRTMEVL